MNISSQFCGVFMLCFILGKLSAADDAVVPRPPPPSPVLVELNELFKLDETLDHFLPRLPRHQTLSPFQLSTPPSATHEQQTSTQQQTLSPTLPTTAEIREHAVASAASPVVNTHSAPSKPNENTVDTGDQLIKNAAETDGHQVEQESIKEMGFPSPALLSVMEQQRRSRYAHEPNSYTSFPPSFVPSKWHQPWLRRYPSWRFSSFLMSHGAMPPVIPNLPPPPPNVY